MKLKFIKTIPIILILISCKRSDENKLPFLIRQQNVKTHSINTNTQGYGSYNIDYIGRKKDTVELSYILYKFLDDLPKGVFDKIKIRNEKDAVYWKRVFPSNSYISYNSSKSDVKIHVDTTQVIASGNGWVVKNDTVASSYPVLITNNSNDTILFDYKLPIFLEAKNSEGIWKRIEKEHLAWLCTGNPNLLIFPPNEIIITSTIIYDGTFETELRLKLGNIYSNVFKGRINEGQFIKDSINQ